MYVNTSQHVYSTSMVIYSGIMVELMCELSVYFMLNVNRISNVFSLLFLYYLFIKPLYIPVFRYLFIYRISTSVILQYKPP